jgi:sugar lactone lactonase YvrE
MREEDPTAREVFMRRYRDLAALTVLVLALPAVAWGAAPFPKTVALPNGFSPEGIATRGDSFYVGSKVSGAIYRGDLRTGEGSILVGPQPGRIAGGMKVDARERLFVAGGPTGKAFVYDARSGADIAVLQLSASQPTFVNDVVLTGSAAWFTDSLRPVLYRIPIAADGQLGSVETLPLTGDFDFAETGPIPIPDRENGIEATAGGRTLVFVTTNTGKLFTVASATGLTNEVELGGERLTGGDGILLDGKTLYVVRNIGGQVAVIQLASDLSRGTVVDKLSDPNFDTPTTVADRGNRLYFVNARLKTPATPATSYWLTQLQKAATKLSGTVGPGRRISLTYADGSKLTVLAGSTNVVITVNDRSRTDNFHLTGKGVNKATGVGFRGRATWKLTLSPGKYVYRSDRRKSVRGTFTVPASD